MDYAADVLDARSVISGLDPFIAVSVWSAETLVLTMSDHRP